MNDPVKAHCPECDGERSCDLHGKVYVPWEWDDRSGSSVNGGVEHSLLQCRGCETVFYETSSWNSEDVDWWHDQNGDIQGENPRTKVTYPKPESKTKPAWIDAIQKVDRQLSRILNEMYVAYDNQSYILTAIGLRTSLDRATEVLGIDPAISFEEKLQALVDQGWIGLTEKEVLQVVTDAGNAAAHRAWSPDNEEIAQLLSASELFLQKAFIVGKKALSLKLNIPAKPKRIRKEQSTRSSASP